MFAPANTAQFKLLLPSVDHDFKVLAFKGSEALNTPYAITVELVSEYPNIDIETFLHHGAFLKFGHNGEGIHGQVYSIRTGEHGHHLSHYSLVLMPRLAYLDHRRNKRIFQGRTVPQIITEVLKEHGILVGAHACFQLGSTVYPPREYCVQYDESDLFFLQRLCEEEGLSFHHVHTPDNHELVFGDNVSAFIVQDPVAFQQDNSLIAEQPVIKRFNVGFNTRSNQVSRRDYDFQQSHVVLDREATTEMTPALEDYDYPGRFDKGDRGTLLARRALERHRSDYQEANGKSDQPILRSGYILELSEHPQLAWNDFWLLTRVEHEGKQPQALLEFANTFASDVGGDGFNQGYRNSFTATPWDATYRPALAHPKSRIHGSQTALVTGPAGEEIYCDAFGRVKIKFHWDRRDPGSDQSSCWVRVASNWAGMNHGAVTVPRVGMEVAVTFLEGDPDQPLIYGCLPHVETPVPYHLPENKSRTVLRSQTTPGGEGYNELHIEDSQGHEKIYLRAQRDLEQRILNDSMADIGNDRREVIRRDSHLDVSFDQFTQIGRHHSRVTAGDETISVHGNGTLDTGNIQNHQGGQSSAGERCPHRRGCPLQSDFAVRRTSHSDQPRGHFQQCDD
ncbi:type VI secretion system tip protein TssI/VgrG [Pseudomonas sp. NPDC098747]|uniref:type VI secretion system tip protein TssI/VgrG n=1 Tax=Pseudomonas sp. NPDC098747 TaxID=3364487 RepID=UPI00383B7A6C